MSPPSPDGFLLFSPPVWHYQAAILPPFGCRASQSFSPLSGVLGVFRLVAVPSPHEPPCSLLDLGVPLLRVFGASLPRPPFFSSAMLNVTRYSSRRRIQPRSCPPTLLWPHCASPSETSFGSRSSPMRTTRPPNSSHRSTHRCLDGLGTARSGEGFCS